MNKGRFLAVFALALLMNFSTGQSSFGAAWDFEEISFHPGLGDAWNRYNYTQVYYEGVPNDDSDDAIYLGTWNQRTSTEVTPGPGDPYDVVNNINYGAGPVPGQVSKGGRIWKYTVSTGHWKLIWPGSLPLSTFSTNEHGWRMGELYNGKIYFGSYASSGESARLIVITPPPPGGFNDTVSFIEPSVQPAPIGNAWVAKWQDIYSIRAMVVHNGMLYIGVEYPQFPPPAIPGELWSYDGTTLKPVWERPSGYGISELEEYGGYLYMGGWYPPTLYRYDDALPISATNPVDITPSEISNECGGPITMEEFGGQFFVGTADLLPNPFTGFLCPAQDQNGFSLFYYTSPSAEPIFITQDAFGGDDSYGWFLKQCDQVLFLGIFSSEGAGGVVGGSDRGLRACGGNCGNPANWPKLNDLVPGIYNPTPTEYGVRTMSCGTPGTPGGSPENLFYGTADNGMPIDTQRISGGTRVFRVEGPFDALPTPPAP